MKRRRNRGQNDMMGSRGNSATGVLAAGLAAVLVAVVFGAAAGAVDAQGSAPPAEVKALAVMYFENRSPGAQWQWLSTGLADMLITDLGRSERLLLVAVLPGLGLVLVAGGPPPGVLRYSNHPLGSHGRLWKYAWAVVLVDDELTVVKVCD